ncbi:plasmid mobilization protein [Mobiluncus mulieris]|uniref:CopG family transcriptional regulator n=1 Tax=Mobiluncus mulieris TaxID=2052 RepID=A0A378PC42_9ACTO|nr:CopG family transcriptional regulator [Mobiluncus mulieris]MCU9969830.1 CopG family transcriptional regulator [Mobiluncus mulieris]MCU9974214.1 CopG family transcriptional regulator [Mobiluncus mulieris]MCU9994388.1 CopG family transcriptional regulator [Mobiluncus mulieris]MCV0010370.1 CopG family transcriptional regulator [Mobiluncus mulieris]NMW64989.1 CopG family transcriptional regulator [Mobiluncus mulieris]
MKPDDMYPGERSDAAVLARFGMTAAGAQREADQVEDENADDGLTGVFYYGSPLDRLGKTEAKQAISVRFTPSEIVRITRQAEEFHISRSEYIRRKVLA